MSHYEINVSLNGHHLFATAERSITTEFKLLDVVSLFAVKFPEAEGYRITVSKQVTTGIPQPLEDLLKKARPLRQPIAS